MAEIVIVGIGMVTPVGLSPTETAASARGRTARIAATTFIDRRNKRINAGCVPDDGLPPLADALVAEPLQAREARVLRLAHVAVEQALSNLPKDAKPPGVIIGLPEQHTRLPIDAAAMIARLATQTEGGFDLGKSQGLPVGRAAGLLAVQAAMEQLNAGEADFVLAGGVDTYLDAYVLGTLDLAGRVRHDDNSDGFAPGEGAALLLLTTTDTAARHNLVPLAKLAAAAGGQEPGHLASDEDYLGEGLAAAVEQALAAANGQPPIGCVYASFNGERYWAKEFGVALLRQRDKFAEDLQMEHPAECFGDLGAAHGAVMLGLASLGLAGGYRRSPAVVYASSDFGARAVVIAAAAS